MPVQAKKQKVIVGLSGGVDSAVSAALLLKEGYDVTGAFIRIALSGYPCTAGEDRRDALRVAAHLQIPFAEIDLSRAYEERVLAYALDAYRRGETPNPDALCNREVKFGLFFDWAVAQGADLVATGHYAQTKQAGRRTHLLAGRDPEKDQSYFLWMVPEERLARTLFPVGGMKKARVRTLAKRFGLPNAERKDSQGLCFLGALSLDDLLKKELRPKKGAVLDENGAVIGEHEGAALYTIGQRHGFALKTRTAQGRPHYVIAKDTERNTITVSAEMHPTDAKNGRTVSMREENWIGEVPPGPCKARFRYRQTLAPAILKQRGVGRTILLREPHFVPLGQSLVLYRGERCLGGGVIDRVY